MILLELQPDPYQAPASFPTLLSSCACRLFTRSWKPVCSAPPLHPGLPSSTPATFLVNIPACDLLRLSPSHTLTAPGSSESPRRMEAEQTLKTAIWQSSRYHGLLEDSNKGAAHVSHPCGAQAEHQALLGVRKWSSGRSSLIP